MHMSFGQLALSVVGIFVTVTFGFASYEFAQSRNASAEVKQSVNTLNVSVNEHHTLDASRDSATRTDVDGVKARMDRMEMMLERISYRVGAQLPPRKDSQP